jgi:hypothetical protein
MIEAWVGGLVADDVEGTYVSLTTVCNVLGSYARGVVLVTLDCCRECDSGERAANLLVPSSE